jgi:cell cycle sensor histidine kinase DivJ
VQYLSLLADLRAGSASSKIDVRLRSIENGDTIFRTYRLEGAASAHAITLIGRSLEGEQKLLDEIATLKAELESERIGKGRLLAAVSHELRTPLNSIIGFSDMLSHEMGGKLANEKQREYAGLIHQSGHYLLELVNAVLDNSRLETGHYSIDPQNFAFRDAAEMCTAVMLPQAEKKGVAFCHRVGTGIGELVADRRAVQQILLNLAGNAVKFTQSGGCVTIDATRIMAEGRPMLEIIVSDTGIGIEPEDMQRIGTPFVRADNNYTRTQEGSGLGLSVVKGLVELHQGSMQLKSCPGEGTIVTIRLPVAGPQFVMGDDEYQELGPELGMVIDMHRHQGERHNDWQNDEDNSQIREQKDAQTRKTA